MNEQSMLQGPSAAVSTSASGAPLSQVQVGLHSSCMHTEISLTCGAGNEFVRYSN